jgi:hypothetical protein
MNESENIKQHLDQVLGRRDEHAVDRFVADGLVVAVDLSNQRHRDERGLHCEIPSHCVAPIGRGERIHLPSGETTLQLESLCVGDAASDAENDVVEGSEARV